jgi:D-alanyl-D-alanine carboxypeptidase
LPPPMLKYLAPSAGTYNCRPIAGTDRMSMHAYGASIDLNTKFANYWRWSKPGKDGKYAWTNQLPQEIVEVFERHGFIWGGRWYHYDTMHFEYRPELLAR